MTTVTEYNECIENKTRYGRKLTEILLSYGFYILFGLMLVIGSLVSPYFFTSDNLMQIIYGSTSLFIIAAGVTLVIISGHLDLSIGSIALISMAISMLAGKGGASFGTMLMIALLVGLAFGLINGVLVAVLKMNPMLTTLGMMIALRGLGLSMTSGGAQVLLRPEFKMLKTAEFLGLKVIIIISVIVMVILQVVLKKTRLGAYCYAIGCNKAAAEKTGLPVKRTIIMMYLISGVCAAMAGITSCIKLGTYSRSIGMGLEFDVIAVCVIGGTSLLGGRGKILPGTLIGILLIYLINNGLALLGASPFIYPFAKGLVIFLAMYVDSLKSLNRK